MHNQPCNAPPLIGELTWSPWHDRYRALAKFDVGQIPAGVDIVSAYAVADWSWYSEPSASWVYVHELLAPFTTAAHDEARCHQCLGQRRR